MSSLLSRVSSSVASTTTKEFKCMIRLLDDQETINCEFQKHHTGQYLLDLACSHLQLVEKDIFGLRFMDSNKHRYWLNLNKPIKKQLRDPTVIKEELTRYQLYLQLRRDLLHGRLYCPLNDAAVLGAYVVQDEIGGYSDLSPSQRDGSDYVSEFKITLRQTAKLEDKIADIHKTLGSMVPAQAEMKFLQKAAEIETYGFDPYTIRHAKEGQVFFGATFRGILVYQANRRVALHSWADIKRIDYLGKELSLHIEQLVTPTIGDGNTSNHINVKHTYTCPSGYFCKQLWRYLLEQKAFFTSDNVTEVKSQRAKTNRLPFLRGSTFRYSNRLVYNELRASRAPSRQQPEIRRCQLQRQPNRADREPLFNKHKYNTLPAGGSRGMDANEYGRVAFLDADEQYQSNSKSDSELTVKKHMYRQLKTLSCVRRSRSDWTSSGYADVDGDDHSAVLHFGSGEHLGPGGSDESLDRMDSNRMPTATSYHSDVIRYGTTSPSPEPVPSARPMTDMTDSVVKEPVAALTTSRLLQADPSCQLMVDSVGQVNSPGAALATSTPNAKQTTAPRTTQQEQQLNVNTTYKEVSGKWNKPSPTSTADRLENMELRYRGKERNGDVVSNGTHKDEAKSTTATARQQPSCFVRFLRLFLGLALVLILLSGAVIALFEQRKYALPPALTRLRDNQYSQMRSVALQGHDRAMERMQAIVQRAQQNLEGLKAKATAKMAK